MPRDFPLNVNAILWELKQNGHPEPLRRVPWALVESARAQLERNHHQTIERMAERGGYSPAELLIGLRGHQLFGPEADAIVADQVRAYVSLLARLALWNLKAEDGDLVGDLVRAQLETGYKYQRFGYGPDGLEPGDKVRLKLKAWIGLFPEDMTGLRVLDVGTNLGAFAFLAAQRGAEAVCAVDVDEDRLEWCRAFRRRVLAQYPAHDWIGRVTFLPKVPARSAAAGGPFDLVLLWSVYHHVFAKEPDHARHFAHYRSLLADKGRLLFEGPFDPDYIIKRLGLGDRWRREDLEAALTQFFAGWRYVGPARHVAGRECVEAWT